METENFRLANLEELKTEFEENQTDWIANVEYVMDNDIEKLQIVTKEGYYFFITETTTEFKGIGEVVDTSDLHRSDVIGLNIIVENENSKTVEITNLSSQDYYQLFYKIDDGNWSAIESGFSTEVPYGSTIFAKLVYGSSQGKEHKLAIANSKPIVKLTGVDTANLARKSNIDMTDLFDVTWGTDGEGTIKYTVSGNYWFDNLEFNSTTTQNLADLELGSYKVTCEVMSPSDQTASAEVNVTIANLANTAIAGVSGTTYGIYSGYDLAKFRDLVNGGQRTINAKLINNISLSKVCSASIGSWTPIAENTYDVALCYAGVFEGNNHSINDLYINAPTEYHRALFGSIKSGKISNLTVGGNVTGRVGAAGIVGVIFKGKNVTIDHCTNDAKITGDDSVGGILAGVWDNAINQNANIMISNCTNSGEVESRITAGGIVGILGYTTGITIESCKNTDIIVASEDYAGGIVGLAEISTGCTTRNCSNTGSITSAHFSGGILGYLYSSSTATLEKVTNSGPITVTTYHGAGGILGSGEVSSNYTIRKAYNKGDVYVGGNAAGGIAGGCYDGSTGTIENAYNEGDISAAGGICGGIIGTTGKNSSYPNSSTCTVTNCHNVGLLTGSNSNRGGITGFIVSGSNMSNSSYNYWLSTCGASYGTGGTTSNSKAEPLSANQMKVKSNFVNWDFTTIWEMDNTKGYPVLRNMPN